MEKIIYTVHVEFDSNWFKDPFPESYSNKRLAKKRAYELFKLYKGLRDKGSLCEGFVVWVGPFNPFNNCFVYERRCL